MSLNFWLTSVRKVFKQYEAERYVEKFCFRLLEHNALVTAYDSNLCLVPLCGHLLTAATIYRQALRYIIHNTTLPQRTRAQAQLELSQMHCYTRLTQINNRCIEGGKSRGVLSDFRMSRVTASVCFPYLASRSDEEIVLLPDACSGREYSGGEESDLVMEVQCGGRQQLVGWLCTFTRHCKAFGVAKVIA